MKKTKKALLSVILSVAMVIAMLPGMGMMAKAAGGISIWSGNYVAKIGIGTGGLGLWVGTSDNEIRISRGEGVAGTVSWTSSDTNVVTINPTSDNDRVLLSAIAAGTATIRAEITETIYDVVTVSCERLDGGSDAEGTEKYTVTVQGGVAEVYTPEGIGPGEEIQVSAGTEVEIREMSSDLGEFIGWNGNISLTIRDGNMNQGVFSFIMPAANVTITARYNTGGGGSSQGGEPTVDSDNIITYTGSAWAGIVENKTYESPFMIKNDSSNTITVFIRNKSDFYRDIPADQKLIVDQGKYTIYSTGTDGIILEEVEGGSGNEEGSGSTTIPDVTNVDIIYDSSQHVAGGNLHIEKNEHISLTAVVTPADANQTVEWTIDNVQLSVVPDANDGKIVEVFSVDDCTAIVTVKATNGTVDTSDDITASVTIAVGTGGEGGGGSSQQETPTGGLFTGRYSKYQVFDVQRDPAFPRSGSTFTVRGLRRPNVGGTEITENGWFYFKPVGNGSTTQRWELTSGQTPYIVELWYNNGSTDTKINDGVIGGLSSEGFLYVANSTGNGYFFSNSAGYDYNYTGTISYTPSAITVCDATTLTSYTPGSMLTPSQTVDPDVTQVINQINALPAAADVTIDNGDAIEAARNSYNALTEAQKANITNVSKLIADEEALAAARENATNSNTISAATTTLAAGDYTLESDVVLTNGLKITSGDVNINLNGHTLSVADNANNSVIYVTGGNVTVSNGTISGGQGNPEIRSSSDGKTRGGGVAVHAGTVTLNDVVIKDNKANWGGGVYLEGDSTVILNNCEVTNNDSIADSAGWNAGGGIFVDDNGIVRLNNTKVTGNKSSNGNWPGISIAENAIIEVSGNTIVYDNKIGSEQQNLSITSPCIKVVGELGATAKIGVRKDSGVITCTDSDKTSWNDATKFVNDNANGGIAKDSSGQLALTDSTPSEEEPSEEPAEEPSGDSNESTAEINIPEPEKTSVKNDEPVVEGLAEAAADEGDDVSLNMVITAEPETALEDNTTLNNNTDIKEEVKGQFKDETSVRVDVLTIDIRKLISGVFTGDLVASTSTILEIGIGYDFANKYDPSLVSKHGNVVKAYATLTARPKAGNYRNGTFFADVANNIFYIYSRDFSDFVISYSTVEGNAQNRSVIDSNATASAESASYAPKTILVYRLFNKVSGNHLFTVNKDERDILVSKGWDDEGIAWQVVASTNTPVYRLFDAAGNGDHFYTASDAVKAELIAKGCVDEGIAWYGQSTTGRTVYKVTNNKLEKGVLTISAAEKDALAAAGFTVEEADFKVN